MKALLFFCLAALLTSCATYCFDHTAQAPRPARDHYHHQQRRHAQQRHRAGHSPLPKH